MSTKFHSVWQDSVTTFKSADMLPPLKRLDLATWRLSNLTAKDKDLTTVPVSPTDGDCYIIPSGAGTVWSGHTNKVTFYDADTTTWIILVPEEGWTCYVQDEDREYIYTGAAWVRKVSYITSAFYPGVLDDAAKVMIHIAVHPFQFAIAFSGSYAKSGATATAETIFSIKKNGSEIGTITFAISGSTGTFAMAAANDVAAGDIISIVGPNTADVTLADLGISLKGLR
jgi:hypothetical protein